MLACPSMDTEQILKTLRSLDRQQVIEVAEKTGLSKETLFSLFYKPFTDLKSSTADVLRDYFERHNGQ